MSSPDVDLEEIAHLTDHFRKPATPLTGPVDVEFNIGRPEFEMSGDEFGSCTFIT